MSQSTNAFAGSTRNIDNTDWLKCFAIIFVTFDHLGLYFFQDHEWLRLVGRLAAPIFFFLIGFAETRKVPAYWVMVGIFLTALDSWDDGWVWVAPNILLSFALFRFCRPLLWRMSVENLPGFLALILILVLFSPISKIFIEYGFEGWIWALFGMYHRLWLHRDRVKVASQKTVLMISQKRIIAGTMAAINFTVHEIADFSFNLSQSLVLIALVVATFAGLSAFRRGPSGVQVSGVGANILTIIGRRTLEIYALQIILFEFIWHAIIH